MQPDSQFAFGSPITVGELKIIPAYRSMVTALNFAAMAVVSPAAVIIVKGTDVEVMLLKDDFKEHEVLAQYQGG